MVSGFGCSSFVFGCHGLPLFISVGLSQGSQTQVWLYDSLSISNIAGTTNGPSSGCVVLTTIGLGLGSWGYSGAARSRSVLESYNSVFTHGTSCSISRWSSSSVLSCKLSAGVGWGFLSLHGQQLPVSITIELQDFVFTNSSFQFPYDIITSLLGSQPAPLISTGSLFAVLGNDFSTFDHASSL
jgi:hypothetical protein